MVFFFLPFIALLQWLDNMEHCLPFWPPPHLPPILPSFSSPPSLQEACSFDPPPLPLHGSACGPHSEERERREGGGEEGRGKESGEGRRDGQPCIVHFTLISMMVRCVCYIDCTLVTLSTYPSEVQLSQPFHPLLSFCLCTGPRILLFLSHLPLLSSLVSALYLSLSVTVLKFRLWLSLRLELTGQSLLRFFPTLLDAFALLLSFLLSLLCLRRTFT